MSKHDNHSSEKSHDSHEKPNHSQDHGTGHEHAGAPTPAHDKHQTGHDHSHGHKEVDAH